MECIVTKTIHFDALIIGSGLAGFTAALHLADEKQVGLVCKDALHDGASWLAQGGIVAMLGGEDSIESHVEDTMIAGCYVNDRDAVTRFSMESAACAEWLINKKVPFTRDDTGLHLTREGGHSQRRILHVNDHTGHSIQLSLNDHIDAGNVSVMEHTSLIDLIVIEGICRGAILMDNLTNSPIIAWAGAVVIATGGVGQIFEHTMAPDSVTGDGIVACWRAGCSVSNMEFIQFHPTGLYMPGLPPFLISEAVRGEGGLLFNSVGERFMGNYDERLELAPRDVVSRAIHSETVRTKHPCAYLQISHLGEDFVKQHFPLIYSTCLERGLDITKERIPVSPVTHYTCGGVVVDENSQTEIENLYCTGEAAYTGLHGANRLASNSLLECVVTGRASAKHILSKNIKVRPDNIEMRWERVSPRLESYAKVIRKRLQTLMWQYVGLVRVTCNLHAAEREIIETINTLHPDRNCYYLSRVHQETFSLLMASLAVCRSAKARPNSIGCHYMADFPQPPKEHRPSYLPSPMPEDFGVAARVAVHDENNEAAIIFLSGRVQAHGIPQGARGGDAGVSA